MIEVRHRIIPGVMSPITALAMCWDIDHENEPGNAITLDVLDAILYTSIAPKDADLMQGFKWRYERWHGKGVDVKNNVALAAWCAGFEVSRVGR